MISIWKKELRSMCTGVVGFLYLAAALFLFGIYFYVMNLYQGMAHVSYAYASCVYLYVVTIPVLTMRSFAQEFHDRTDQLLFTSPVPLWKIVIGKYLAMLTLFMIPVVAAAAFPLLLTSYGNVAVTEAYMTLIAAVFYGMAAIAIGMFISSLTRNIVVAAVLTAVLLFIAYTIGGFGEMLGIPVLRGLFDTIDMRARFVTMESGVLSLRSLFYFLTVAAAFVVLTMIRLKQLRGGFGGNGRKRIYRGTAVAVTIVVTVLLNVLGAVLPDSVMEHDLTVQEYHQLTEQTKMLLNNIDQEVLIYVYAKKESADENVTKMLNNYCSYPNISAEYVNPELSPEFTLKYASNGLDDGSLIVTSGTRHRNIPYGSIYTWSDESMSDYTAPDGFDLEGQLTSAIDYVTTESIPKVYQITGHGELTLEGNFAKSVERENVDLEELSLVSAGSVPADAQCLLILAPGEDYSEAEISALKDYLERGGNLYVLLKWREEPEERLNGLLREYGIIVENGIVSETDKEVYFQEPYYLIPEIKSTEVTEKLAGNLALSVLTVGMRSENPDIKPILITGKNAFLKKDPQNSESREWEPGDETGEYLLGLYLERDVKLSGDDAQGGADVTKKSRIVVFGSPLITQDAIDEYISGMNLKLFAEIFSHMVSHPVRISVPAKSYVLRYVTVSEADARFFGVILSGVIPGLVLIAGIVTALVRRRR